MPVIDNSFKGEYRGRAVLLILFNRLEKTGNADQINSTNEYHTGY